MSLFMSVDVYSYLTIGLDLKIYPKMTLKLPKLKICAFDQKEMYFFMAAADVHSELTIGLASKNYPKIIPDTLKSIHWIRSYGDVFSHYWIGLEKIPQNDS